MSVQFSLAGQVALVTGGATGLGLAIATASPLAAYITGTTLVVDGGTSAGCAGLRPAGE